MVLNKDYRPEADEEDWDFVAAEDEITEAEAEDPDPSPTSAVSADECQSSNVSQPEESHLLPTTNEGQESKEIGVQSEATNEETQQDAKESADEEGTNIDEDVNSNKVSEETETSTLPGGEKEEPTTTMENSENVDSKHTNEEELQKENEEEQTPLLSKKATEEEATEATAEKNHNNDDPSPSNKPSTSSPQQTHSTDSSSKAGNWFRKSLTTIGTVLKDVDQKHHIQQKARTSVKQVEASVRQLHTSIDEKSQQITKVIEAKVIEADVPGKAKVVENKTMQAAHAVEQKAKVVGGHIQKGATAATHKVKNLNKDGKVTDFLTAAAVVGAGVLLAKGKPGASAAVLATGGVAYAAKEAARQPNRQYHDGLNEELHMD